MHVDMRLHRTCDARAACTETYASSILLSFKRFLSLFLAFIHVVGSHFFLSN